MHFPFLTVAFDQKCYPDQIEAFDTALLRVWKNPNTRTGFTLGAMCRLVPKLDPKLVEAMVIDLAKVGFLPPHFAVACPQCGEVTEQYDQTQVKSADELSGTQSHCSTCNEDFDVGLAEISVEYAFAPEFSPEDQ